MIFDTNESVIQVVKLSDVEYFTFGKSLRMVIVLKFLKYYKIHHFVGELINFPDLNL